MINNGEPLNIRRKVGTAYPHFPLWCWTQGSEKERTRWSMLSRLWKNPPSIGGEGRGRQKIESTEEKRQGKDDHSPSTIQSITG